MDTTSKVNYSKLMEQALQSIGDKKPLLLLHCCCAPCSTHVLDVLCEHFKVLIHFANPNIYPQEEYNKRLNELYRYIDAAKPGNIAGFIADDYSHEQFLNAVKGLESEPEGGARCAVCFKLRLESAARAAKEAGAEYFTTTLTVSPHKNAAVLNTTGLELAGKYGIEFLCSDFKKHDGYKHSIQLCAQYGIYRQSYCGCEFSVK